MEPSSPVISEARSPLFQHNSIGCTDVKTPHSAPGMLASPQSYHVPPSPQQPFSAPPSACFLEEAELPPIQHMPNLVEGGQPQLGGHELPHIGLSGHIQPNLDLNQQVNGMIQPVHNQPVLAPTHIVHGVNSGPRIPQMELHSPSQPERWRRTSPSSNHVVYTQNHASPANQADYDHASPATQMGYTPNHASPAVVYNSDHASPANQAGYDHASPVTQVVYTSDHASPANQAVSEEENIMDLIKDLESFGKFSLRWKPLKEQNEMN